ncbi:hypothetical protein JT30_3340 [Burkholderia pseudomallei]|nr:hypothetical protein JT30_3340 [Burkholderia pseudomallei]
MYKKTSRLAIAAAVLALSFGAASRAAPPTCRRRAAWAAIIIWKAARS